MTKQLVLRIDDKLKSQFARLAKSGGKTTSELLRELMEKHIKEHDISGYVDELWKRIGNQMKSSGAAAENINDYIAEIRNDDF